MFKLMFVLFAVAASSAIAAPEPKAAPGVVTTAYGAPLGYAAAPIATAPLAYASPLAYSATLVSTAYSVPYGYSSYAAAPLATTYAAAPGAVVLG